jgi:hypothetical protein
MSEQYVYCPGLCCARVVYRSDPNSVSFCCLNCWERVADELHLRGDAPPLSEDHQAHSDQCAQRQEARQDAEVLNIAVGFRLNMGEHRADNDQTPPASLQ